MRVIAGTARHLKLITPEGQDTRPTLDSIRETLFNILRNDVPGSVFIDLCAGSGAIGIEALSRGAEKAYFVEYKSAAVKCLIQNLETTKFSDRSVVIKSDAVASLSRINETAVDIVYIDPPYNAGLYQPVLATLSEQPYMNPYTLIIVECDAHEDFSFAEDLGYTVTREKKYKHNKHVFLKLAFLEERQK